MGARPFTPRSSRKRWIDNFPLKTKDLILLRGLPGSGKTRLAAELAAKTAGAIVVTTDTPIAGVNEPFLSPYRMGIAYELACGDTLRAAAGSAPRIIVDHTNATNWEMGAFARIGVQRGYSVFVQEPATPWAKDPDECYLHSPQSGLTREDMRDLAASWEDTLPIAEILKAPTPLERRAECQALIAYAKASTDMEERSVITRGMFDAYADQLLSAVHSGPLPAPSNLPELVARMKERGSPKQKASPLPVREAAKNDPVVRARELIRDIGSLGSGFDHEPSGP